MMFLFHSGTKWLKSYLPPRLLHYSTLLPLIAKVIESSQVMLCLQKESYTIMNILNDDLVLIILHHLIKSVVVRLI